MYQQRTYKLRSPMLDSSAYKEEHDKKKFSFLVTISKVFWIFALVFFA